MTLVEFSRNNFKGVSILDGFTASSVLQCINFDYGFDKDTLTYGISFLKKYPLENQLGNTVSGATSLGMYLFMPVNYAIDDNKRILQGFDDGTVRYLAGGTTWTSIITGLNTYLPLTFTSYNDWAIFSNGRQPMYKWRTNWISATQIRDKTGTLAPLTGILTFTEDSNTVTGNTGGSGTKFLTELVPGALIQREVPSPYDPDNFYEVNSIIDDHTLILSTPFAGATGAGGSGTSTKAPPALIRARFVQVFNDRLFALSGDSSGLPLVGTAKVGSKDIRLP